MRGWWLALVVACGPTTPTVETPEPTPIGGEPGTRNDPEAPPPAMDRGEPWVVTFNPGPWFDRAADVLADPSGVYVSGTRDRPRKSWLTQKRALDDGSLIWEVASPATTIGPRALARSAASLWVAGDTRVERRSLSDGSPIRSFGSDGSVEIPDHVIHDIVATTDALYLIGESHTGHRGFWVQKRFTSNGALDPAFGSGGDVFARGGPASNYWLEGTLVRDTLYVAGFEAVSNGRVDAIDAQTGAPVATFGDGGTLRMRGMRGGIAHIAGTDAGVFTVGMHAGSWLLTRQSISGAEIWSRRFTPGRGRGQGHHVDAVAADANGVVFGGSAGNSAWVLRSGDVDDETVRRVMRDPSPGRDQLTALALSEGFIYAFGFETVDGQDTQWRLERFPRDAGRVLPRTQPAQAQPSPRPPAQRPTAQRPTGVDPQQQACEARGPNCRWVPSSPCLGRGARCMDHERGGLGTTGGYTCHCREVDSSGTPVLPQ